MIEKARQLPALMALPILLLAGAPVQAAPVWGAYHDATPAQHKQKFDAFSKSGFRMISLSVYNTPSNPLCAAVWVKTSGPEYQSWQTLTSAGYQQKVDDGLEGGFRPTIVAATSSGGSASFSCVLEKDGKQFMAKHGIDWSVVYWYNDWAKSHDMVLKWIDNYGFGQYGRYGVIWEKNTTGVDWKVHSNLSGSTLGDFIESYKGDGYRVAHIDVSPEGKYTALWRDDITGLRKIFWGMTSAGYQDKTEEMWDDGYRPVCVQAGGSGSDTRFAAIYVKD